MVGLFINTVPVRASITPATTTADLLDQLQGAHNDTLEHQHLALSEIHRITGHDQLFDTLFVYENYPIDTAALSGDRRAGHHRVHQPRIHPLPADGAGDAGPRTGPSRRIRHRRVRRGRHRGAGRAVAAGVGGDDRRPGGGGCRRWICSMPVSMPGWMSWGNRAVLTRPAPARDVDSGVVRRTGRAHAGGGGGDLRGRVDDLSRARRGVESVGAPAGRPRRRPGRVCGAAVRAVGRGDRRDAGGAQDRGGVSADRSGAARGADRVHARRCRAGRRDHHRRTAAAAGRVRPAGHRRRRPRCRRPTQHRACRRRPPTTSPTSSTPRAPPGSPRAWRSPTTT